MSDSEPGLATIFGAALERTDPVARAAYLDVTCGSNGDLRRQIEMLLAAHDQAGHFLESGPLSPPSNVPTGIFEHDSDFNAETATGPGQVSHPHSNRDLTATLGTVIAGRYKLVKVIGEGGMGSVYRAEQSEPIKRQVALKLIKTGMDSKSVLARFDAERQALAMMDHPNIARVYDGGTTATGQPFFVMELVHGVPLTTYCDQHRLSVDSRLQLFVSVCQAVQHAHQKGIIHRDLKPGNVLVAEVDGQPVCKVIDFGVAKATEIDLTDMSFSDTGAIVGTPAYMSPEQADPASMDIDTRTDVYALGVMLYELLTGSPPIDSKQFQRGAILEMLRMVREVDPPRPSTKLSTADALPNIAANRDIEPARLSKMLQGELDWVVMKALEKDRARRYETANGLARDLQRFLAKQPVEARPASAAYRLKKGWQRNKLACVAVTAVAASLVIGITLSVWQAVRAEREAARARHMEQRAVATLDELRTSAPAFAEQARALAERENFGEAIAKLDYALQLRPDVAEYLLAKADLLQCQLKLAEAVNIYREALRLKPTLTQAEESARLCDELLAAKPTEQGRPTRESLARLHLAMQRQQRPAAEIMPVARLLGEEKQHLVDYWLARLKDLPVPPERPLARRLTVRDDGRLNLDLRNVNVLNLTMLEGAPIASLNLCGFDTPGLLSDLSPLRELPLIELDISGTAVKDLSPLSGMRTLESLNVAGSKVSDLGEIAGLRLKHLNFQGTSVRDLTPIKNMPLEEISIRDTQVADISSLIGMPIKSIDIANVPLNDFSPLAQLPLEKCYCKGARITDLSVFRGRPLKELVLWNCHGARNYAVLAELETLEFLVVPASFRNLPEKDYVAIGALRRLPRLRQLGTEDTEGTGIFVSDSYQAGGGDSEFNKHVHAAIPAKETFWKVWDREQAFVPALRKTGFAFTLVQLSHGRYALWMREQALTNLSMLRGAPLAELWLISCPQLSDISAIEGMPLEILNVCFSKVSNLEPLRGLPLRRVFLSATPIVDLSPLVGAPIKDLYLDRCKEPIDVAPLFKIPTLHSLLVPEHAVNMDTLRKHPSLERLGYKLTGILPMLPEFSVEEFWKSYVSNEWITELRNSGIRTKTRKRLDDGTWELDLSDSAVRDLTLIKGAPISSLTLNRTAISDLTPLRGMPLKSLRLYGCNEVTDLSPLSECKQLTDLTLPPNATHFESLRTLPFRRLSFSGDSKNLFNPDKPAVDFWKDYDAQAWRRALLAQGIPLSASKKLADGTWEIELKDTKITDLSPIKGAAISRMTLNRTAITDLEPLRGMPLRRLLFDNVPVKDPAPLEKMPLETLMMNSTKINNLSPLRGMPLKELAFGNTTVEDLSPLKGLPLKSLRMDNTRVADLTPLAGMPLEDLNMRGTKVIDLSPVRGCPLHSLLLFNCRELTDLSPLAECKELKEITLPPNARDVQFLRTFPKLERISFKEEPRNNTRPDKSAAEFWIEYDISKR